MDITFPSYVSDLNKYFENIKKKTRGTRGHGIAVLVLSNFQCAMSIYLNKLKRLLSECYL